MNLSPEIHEGLKTAVQKFWGTRQTQAIKQGASSGSKDAGARSAVTGGAQIEWFRRSGQRPSLQERPSRGTCLLRKTRRTAWLVPS